MARTTKAQREADDRLRIAFEAGVDYFTAHADELMVEVHRYASKIYGDKAEGLEFVMGYSKARAQREEYLREKKQ
jgi:hypothetical protein